MPKPAAQPPQVPLWARIFRQTLEVSLTAESWRPFEMGSVINFQKGGTLFFLSALMSYYGNFSTRAWTYLALHGSYGMLWYLKDKAFPDPSWRRPVGPLGALVMYSAVLGHYWAIGWMVMSGRAAPASALPLSEGAWCAIAVILHTLGCGIMIAADAQKYFTLAAKKGLITNGMFAYVRHPNYLGEMMLYSAYALLAWRPYPWTVLISVWIVLFATNMVYKEASMSRYPEWEAYRRRTWWLAPYLF